MILVYDISGPQVVVIQDATEAETYVVLDADVDGTPLDFIDVNGNRHIRGAIKTHQIEVFGEID